MLRCLAEFSWRGCWYKLLIALLFLAASFAAFSGISFADSKEPGTAGSPNFRLQPVYYDAANPASKSYFIIDTQKGALIQEQVRVTNVGTAAGTVKLFPADATTGQEGGVVYSPHNQTFHGVGSWITLGEQQLTLAPGQSQIVPFQVAVPQGVSQGQHIGGLLAQDTTLQSSTSKIGKGQLQVNVQHQTVITVLLNLPGSQTVQLAATGVQAGGSNGYQQILVGLENTGIMMLRAHGNLQVTDSQGHLLQTLAMNVGTFLPQASINYPVFVQKKALGPGTYHAVLALRYGLHGTRDVYDHTLNYATTFTVTQQQVKQVFPNAPLQAPLVASSFLPLWAMILLAVLGVLMVGGLSGLFFWRLAVRSITGSSSTGAGNTKLKRGKKR